jgi:hypothetical protein
LVFSQIPQLPGCTPLTPDEEDALTRLGAALGTIVYGVDALEDLEDDLRSGAFNPCLRDGVSDRERLEATAAMVQDSLAVIEDCLSLLPLQRHRELLENILVERQARKADKAADAARAFTAAAEPPTARWKRNLTALWAMMLSMWGLLTMSEEEDEQRRRSSCADCGSCDGCGFDCCCHVLDPSSRNDGDGCTVCDCDGCGDCGDCGGCGDCEGGCCGVCECCGSCDCG